MDTVKNKVPVSNLLSSFYINEWCCNCKTIVGIYFYNKIETGGVKTSNIGE